MLLINPIKFRVLDTSQKCCMNSRMNWPCDFSLSYRLYKENLYMEKTINLLIFSLYNTSNIKLIAININQGNKYGNKWI